RPREPHQRMIEIDDLIEPRAKQILLAGFPPLLRSHARPLSDHTEKTESRPPIRGNPKIDFAKKPQAPARKLPNTTPLPETINHTIQWHAASSRTTTSSCLAGSGSMFQPASLQALA